MKRIPRRTFTAEFEAEAVKLVTQHNLTYAEASRKLEVATLSLRTWIAQHLRGGLKANQGANKLSCD